MKKSIFITLLTFCCATLIAQPQAKIKKDAQAMADATVKGDYAKTISFIYPKVLTQWGGKNEILKHTGDFKARFQSSGINISSITVGNIGDVMAMGTREFSQFYVRIAVTANGPPMNTGLAMLAVSEDKGNKWYFISAGMVTDAKLYEFFPEIKGKITLPKPAIPVMPQAK